MEDWMFNSCESLDKSWKTKCLTSGDVSTDQK